MNKNEFTFFIKTPRREVYRALTEAPMISQWRVPEGMSCEIHQFESRENGKFRISLTYHDPNLVGKSASHTDTYHGYFKKLVPNELVVEVMEFETSDPAMSGSMTSTIRLGEKNGGTEILAVHDGVPNGIRPEDNEEGWRQSFAKLACLLEKQT